MSIRKSFIVLGMVFLLAGQYADGEEASTQAAPEANDIQSVINTLENSEQREKLIGHLKLLVENQKAIDRSREKPTLGNTTVDLLKFLSDRIARSVETTVKAATLFHQIPRVADWVERQILNLDRRNLWLGVIQNLAAIMLNAYLAYFIVRWLLQHLRDVLGRYPSKNATMRIIKLSGLLSLALLPILAFIVVGYLMLGVIRPTESIRLVAIAWINAAAIVHAVMAAVRSFLATEYPSLRLWSVGDRTVLSIERWARWLSMTVVYGFLSLQAALLIGMPLPLYETLLRLLGLLVVGMLMILIMLNRHNVAQHLLGVETSEESQLHPHHFVRKLASVWHIMAIIYVLLLYGIWALAWTGGFAFVLKGTLLTLLILAVGNSLTWLIEQIFRDGFRIGEGLGQRFPSLERRLNRYSPILKTGMKGLVHLVMLLAVLQAWGVSTIGWMTSRLGRTFSAEIAKVAGIVLATLLLWEASMLFMDSYLGTTSAAPRQKPPSPRLRTLLSVAHNAFFIVLIVMSALIILSDLGINIAPMLAGVGVAGLALGFGAQKLVQDIITGIFILFEDLIAVGDVVSVGNKDGLVEAITIRTIRLRDLAGNVHTIPFSSIGPITNMTKDFSYHVFNVGVSYRQDIDVVMDELAALGQELMQDPAYAQLILEPLEILGIDSIANSAVLIKARIKTLPIKQWTVGREFNRRMKKRFDQLAIEMSLP